MWHDPPDYTQLRRGMLVQRLLLPGRHAVVLGISDEDARDSRTDWGFIKVLCDEGLKEIHYTNLAPVPDQGDVVG